MDIREEAQRSTQEAIRASIDHDLRQRLRIHPDVKIRVKRIVEGDQPVWVAYLTDKVNERVLVNARVVEELLINARDRFYNGTTTKAFLEAFADEDPVFFEKTFQPTVMEEEDEEVPVVAPAESEHFEVLIEVLSLLVSDKVESATDLLAEYTLEVAKSIGAEERLMAIDGVYEPVTTLRLRRRSKVDY